MIFSILNLNCWYLRVIITISVLILVRIVVVLYNIRRHRSAEQTVCGSNGRKKPVKTMIVLGSGLNSSAFV